MELEYQLECDGLAKNRNALLLHWGFGIGSAVSFHGRLLTSSIGRSGEIGHVRLDPRRRRRCLCGSRGCLETVASLWALLPIIRKQVGELPTIEQELAPLLADSRVRTLPEVREAFVAIQDALVVLFKIFYPDLVFLSGPFVSEMTAFTQVSEGFRKMLPRYAQEAVTIRSVPLGMPGCRRGGANPIFRSALGQTLRRST